MTFFEISAAAAIGLMMGFIALPGGLTTCPLVRALFSDGWFSPDRRKNVDQYRTGG